VTSFTNQYFGGTAAVPFPTFLNLFSSPDGSEVWVAHPFVQFSSMLEVVARAHAAVTPTALKSRAA
jgi:hypothetical protein